MPAISPYNSIAIYALISVLLGAAVASTTTNALVAPPRPLGSEYEWHEASNSLDPATSKPACRIFNGTSTLGSIREQWLYCPGTCSGEGRFTDMVTTSHHSPLNVPFQTSCSQNPSNGLVVTSPTKNITWIEYTEDYASTHPTGSCTLKLVLESLGAPLTVGMSASDSSGCSYPSMPCDWTYISAQNGFKLLSNETQYPTPDNKPKFKLVARTDAPTSQPFSWLPTRLSYDVSVVTTVCNAAMACMDEHELVQNPKSVDTMGSKFFCLEDAADALGLNIAVKKTGQGDVACLSTDGRNCNRMTSTCCNSLVITDQYQATGYCQSTGAICASSAPFLACGAQHLAVWGHSGYDVKSHWCNVGMDLLNKTENADLVKPVGPFSMTTTVTATQGQATASPTGMGSATTIAATTGSATATSMSIPSSASRMIWNSTGMISLLLLLLGLALL